MADTPTTEQINDTELQTLTDAYHHRHCRNPHSMDDWEMCLYEYLPWQFTTGNGRSTLKHRWMHALLDQMNHAASCGISREQFIAYEQLDRATQQA